ncbi:hypothetical protein HYV84_06835 [Candidatus Woesearchaeota archaeon]|nr:hypothetical protein [Candidatus Woesearchaeota archaeon]
MKKLELVYRHLLYGAMEKKNRELTISSLAKTLSLSLSTVHLALKPLVRMNAISMKLRGFTVIDLKKILYYWASVRNIEKDIVYATRVEEPVTEIEKQMPDDVVFTAFSGYKFKFKDVPADYSEVYVYGGESVQKRWKKEMAGGNRSSGGTKNNPNVFVLQKDELVGSYGKTATIAQLFVDLWNLRQWYAKDFLTALEVHVGRILE